MNRPATFRRRATPSAIVALALTLLPALAAAQDAPAPAPADAPLPPSIPELVVQLDHEDYAQREAAMTALMLREDLDDTELAKALRSAESPESKQRLKQVALHRSYARLTPPGLRVDDGMGCIGIDISKRNIVREDQHPELKQPALLVTRTRVGFPAYALLRPGDLLLSFEGHAFGNDLADEQALVALIQKYRAGQVVKLSVLRGSERMTVDMKLDSFDRLQAVTQMLTSRDFPQLYEPWRAHLRNLMGGEDEGEPLRLDPPAAPAEGAAPEPAPESDDDAGTS